MNTLKELELNIVELSDGRLTHVRKEVECYQPGRVPVYYCTHCHREVWLVRHERRYFFAHPVDGDYADCPEVKCALSYLSRQSEEISGLEPLRPITEWYCVLCRRYYVIKYRPMKKCCPNCREGLYSIPANQVTHDHNTIHYATAVLAPPEPVLALPSAD